MLVDFMPDWLSQLLLGVAGALVIAYGTKRISAQASLIEKMRSQYALDRQTLEAQHSKQIALMQQQIDGLKESYDRQQAEMKELRLMLAPAQAGIRIRDDYIHTLRGGYKEFSAVPPPYPVEMRDQ